MSASPLTVWSAVADGPFCAPPHFVARSFAGLVEKVLEELNRFVPAPIVSEVWSATQLASLWEEIFPESVLFVGSEEI